MSPIRRPVLLLAALASTLCAQRGLVHIQVQQKLALVIGNSDYARAPLKNPVNDATAMEATFKRLGFQVTVVRNADLRRMRGAIDSFAASLGPGAFGFFYFAGHGLQVNRTNYLVPIDYAATSQDDVQYEAYPAERIKDKLEGSGASLRVLVLDACRDNPWNYSRDGLQGLAPMSVNAVGTLIAYATGDNNTAADSPADANGLYTKYLMAALLTRGLNLRDAFQKAKEEVYQASRRQQNPTIYENIVGQYSLTADPGPAIEAPLARVDVAALMWARIENSKDPEDFDSFARAYPNSEYAPGAQMIAAKIRRGQAIASTSSAGASNARQTMPADARPSFKIATIKASRPEDGFSLLVDGSGMLNTSASSFADLLKFAYGLHARQIAGGPAWIGTEKYDITAKPDTEGIPNEQQLQGMLQKLLADRFQLIFHREKKELSVYAITKANTGPRLTRNDSNPGGLPSFRAAGPGGRQAGNATIAEFANYLQAYVLEWPVVDQTGLGAARWDFTLKWTPGAPPNAHPPALSADVPPDIFLAMQQQLGLKLEMTKAPVDVLVIDKVEKPSAN